MQSSGGTELSGGSTPANTGSTVLAGEGSTNSQVGKDGTNLPASTVLTIPTSKFEPRCKVCKLANTHQELFLLVHEGVIKHGRSYHGIVQDANKWINDNNVSMPPFNLPNMQVHFTKHVDVDRNFAMALSKANNSSVPLGAYRSLAEVEQMMMESVSQTDIDDFNNLNDIRKRITIVLYSLQSQLEEIDEHGKLRLNKHAVQLFTALVSETRACIVDLSKMRMSERLLKQVVQALLDRMTFAIVPQLLEEYKLVSEELSHAGIPMEIINRVDDRLRRKTAEIIAVTARAAVTEISRVFKLK